MHLNTRIPVLLAIAAATVCASTSAVALVPVLGTTPTLTQVAIDTNTGDQYDPHVSGDWAAYTSELTIRYYNFATGVNAQIPLGTGARDLLSDVSGSRIVYSHVIAGDRTAVMVFDASTPAVLPVELDPAPGTTRLGAAIGGNTVAYIDYGLQANGELVIHDLAGGPTSRMTFDALPDQGPSVSSDGKVVTWEHCSSSLNNCDVWRADKIGGVWTASVVTASSSTEENAESSGGLVVYDALHSPTPSEVYWVPSPGAPEVELQQPGYSGWPSIAGHTVALENRPTLIDNADMWCYDIANNTIFQITDTPLANEQLNDLTSLPNGRVRMVWCSDEDGADQRNIHAATFRLPSNASQVPGLFNTGVNSDRYLLNPGNVDLHYTLIGSADPAHRGPNAYVADPIPTGYWAGNSTVSQWIAPAVAEGYPTGGTLHPPGDYIYRLSFDLTDLNPATVAISGVWAADNTATLVLNGAATGNSVPGYNPLLPFSVTSGFVPGINNLDFVVHNANADVVNPTGLRVEDIEGVGNSTLDITGRAPGSTFQLLFPYPNPMHGITRIGFSLPRSSHIQLAIRDLAGRNIRTLASAHYPAGSFDLAWDGIRDDGSPAPAGLYFIDLLAGVSHSTRRVIVLP